MIETKGRNTLKKSVEVLKQLREIVVKSQRDPNSYLDGAKELQRYNDAGGRTRMFQLVNDVKDHCKFIEELGSIDRESVNILDKPNMHRLVELFTHTLPLFGSLKFIEELILEKAHQGAKRAVDMSNKKNEHVQGMMVYLQDDFVTRLRSITKDIETPGSW